MTDMTGGGAGAAEAYNQIQNRELQYSMLRSQDQYRSQELMIHMMDIMNKNAVLSRQTNQAQYTAVKAESDAMRTLAERYVANQPEAAFNPNSSGAQAVTGRFIHQAAIEAAAYTNAFGGDPQKNLQDTLNRWMLTFQATPTKVGEAMTSAFADRAKVETGLKLQIPTLEGMAKGQTALATSQNGGAAAEQANTAARESVTPRVVSPDQSVVVPPPGSIPGAPMPGPAVVNPGQAAVAPPMPAIPVTPVASAPLAPPGGAAAVPAATVPAAGPGPAAPASPLPAQRPGTVVPAQMAPGTFEAEKELGKNFGSENEQKAYRGAQSSLQNLYQIMSGIDRLTQAGGFQNPGAGADFRNDFAKTINSISQAFGTQPPFDPMAVASWEDVTKNVKLMGMQVINQYFGGSREAQSIVQAGISAVPSSTNTPLGARMVASGVEQAMQRGIELHDFIAARAATNQPLSTAETEFNKTHPPGLYAMRGIANAVPKGYADGLMAGKIKPEDIDKRFGKGVAEFILKGGRTGIGAAGGFTGTE